MLRLVCVLLFLVVPGWGVGLRVVTFNIETHRNTDGWPDYALGDPGTVDHDSVASILARIDADVVALQEVHTADLNGSPSEVEQLAATLGLPYIHAGSNSGNFDTSLRVVFLSRFPFTMADTIFSPAGAKEIARHCPAVVVDVPGTNADPLLISAHLKSGTGSDDRFRRAIEMRRLTDYLTASGFEGSDNFIVLGDFNPSGIDKVFTELPAGLPSTFALGTDVSFPVSYSTNMVSYFTGPIPTLLDPRQLNGNDGTYEFGQTLDLLLVSAGLAGRPYSAEIYNSGLDVSNSDGLPKSGSPLAASTSSDASDHYAVFADFELDQALFNLALAGSIPSVMEGAAAGTLTLTASLAAPADSPVTVEFSSSDPAALPIDSSVVIPAGASVATTGVVTRRNYVADGSRTVTFAVDAVGYAAATVAAQLLDSDDGYRFTQPGETVVEHFDGFEGSAVPAPWLSDAAGWLGVDDGGLTAPGPRAYGSGDEHAVGWLSDGSAMVMTTSVTNDSTTPLTMLDLTYAAEQWLSNAGGSGGGIEVELVSDGVVIPLPSMSFAARTDLPSGPLAGGSPDVRSARVAGLAVDPGESFDLRFRFVVDDGAAPLPDEVFINEFHYDNASDDTGEFVEVVVGPGFLGALDQVELLLYNGNNGELYGSGHLLGGFDVGATTADGYRIFSKQIAGIQNGGPDGMVLVVNGQVAEFISYEGSFVATEGPASGMSSVDVGVAQSPNGSPSQNSIGRTGSGSLAADFSWARFDGLDHSDGDLNPSQTFSLPGPPAQGIAIDSIELTFLEDSDFDGVPDEEDVDDDNDGMDDLDELAFGSDPLDAASRFAVGMAFEGGNHELSFPGTAGISYTIEWCDDLVTWVPLSTHVGNDAEITVALPSSASRLFFRVRAGE